MDIDKIKQSKATGELLEFGILNIDKPSGPTSFNVSDFVGKTLKQFGMRKTSHFGTLDPKVTGVLPIALNRACKLTGFFIGENKEYVGIMRIHEDIELNKIEAKIKEKFLGKIKQTPPKKSRVKREEREREIHSFEILEKEGFNIVFRTEVQGGTYIRKLIDDLGHELNIGAHMLELRRTRAGIFSEHDEKYPSVNLYEFERAVEKYSKGNEEELRKIIIPAEIIATLYDAIEIKKESLKRIFTGKPIQKSDLKKDYEFETGKIVSCFSGEKFVGMYKITNDEYFFAKPEFVMQPVRN